ncbi:ABC transporter permease [Ammoniphilus oxalaticus]|uniref:ABC transporter permease n=1 Tax=Ammoniphilus oxalaticus TaxID=66863 RepID=A0A419SEJ5_9BACL|nr:ABC transporter permease [Ammoniphilus oxalaticus]RKD21759.1 ABC transporter permease [Ammoniphilus oxalaticus]
MKNSRLLLIITVAFGLAWEGIVRLLNVPVFILPPPSRIFAALGKHWELLLFTHLPVTLWEVILGLFLSIVIAVGAAMLIHFSEIGERVLYPIVIASQTIPIVALSPILIMWFGYSIWGKVAVTILITFFPIVVGGVDGLRATNQEWVNLMKTMGANSRQIFFKVQIPQALPAFFSGLKVAATASVIGATIGEWLGASAGLGFFSRRASHNLQADLLFATVFLLSIAGFVLFYTIQWIEKKSIPWFYEEKK